MSSLNKISTHPPSISTISDTTINTSVVATFNPEMESIYDDHFGFEPSTDEMLGQVKKLDKNKVQVGQFGDVNHIYHFYTPPTNEILTGLPSDLPKINLKRENKTEKPSEFRKKSKFSSISCCFWSRKRKIISIILFCVIFIIASASTVLVVNLTNKNPETTLDPQTTSTFDPTTTEITTTTEFTTTASTTQSTSTTTSSPTTTSTAPSNKNYILFPRSEWTSEEIDGNINRLNLPIKRIIVAHSADSSSTCNTKSECIARIQSIKSINSSLRDVPYNYFIGGDGNLYEGRGFRHEGEHTSNQYASNYNEIGIGIAFIGNYQNEAPTTKQIQALNDFILDFVENETISADYKVFLQDQLTFKLNKSTALNNVVMNMTNFYNLQKIYNRQDWGAKPRCGPIDEMKVPQNRSILYHTTNPYLCHSLENCTKTLQNIQTFSQNNCDKSDAPWGFCIGGSGEFSMVMEIRGFSYMGAHALKFNRYSIGIALVGEFNQLHPSDKMMKTLQQFLKDAVALGKLTSNYLLSPNYIGQNLIDIIKEWDNYALLP